MKSLKNYIKDYVNENYLNESIWDIDNNIEDNNEEFAIRNFIDTNYECKGELKISKEGDTYYVDCVDDVIVKNKKLTSLTDGLFKWNYVDGEFDCSYCLIETLEGAPEEVYGSINCSGCKKLISLKGAPESVQSFDCSGTSIKSLDYAPLRTMEFYCSNCDKLEDISWIYNHGGYVDGQFQCCNNKKLKSISHLPEKNAYEGYVIDLSNNINLRSLDGCPDAAVALNLAGCKSLKDLQYIPQRISFYLNLSNCKGLKNLDYVSFYNNIDIYIGGCNNLVLDGKKLTKMSEDELKSLGATYKVKFLNFVKP